MYQTIRKKSLRRLLPRIITAFALAVLLLVSTGFGIFRLVFGPTDLSALTENSLSGKYVSFDASQSIAAYASFGSSDSGSGSKTQYYVLTFGDKYMSITATPDYYDRLDAASDQSQEYYQGDLTELSPLGELTGTVAPLSDDLKGYMTSGISGISLPGADDEAEAAQHVLAYTVKLGYVGWMTKTLCIVVSCLALVCLIYGVVMLVLALNGFYDRDVKTRIAEKDMDAVEQDFANGIVHDQIVVGKKYTWFFKGPKCSVIPTAEIVWAYCEANPLVVSKYQWPMAMYLQDKSYYSVAIQTKDEINQIISEIAAIGSPFVDGYNSNKSKMFKNDFNAFMEMAKENRKNS